MRIFWVTLCALFLGICGVSSRDCRFIESCGECIQNIDPPCSWCEDVVYVWLEQPRDKCDSFINHTRNGCQKIANPSSEAITHQPLDFGIFLKKQIVILSGQPATVKVDVKMPGNYPVDLYYLMDLSGSMVEDLKRFPTLGDSIAKEITNITRNFRLGFGAFVDKPLAPYIETQPGSNPNMVPAFGFVNQLSLTENISEFESVINRVNISGNIDNPEGTLDALMQIAVCDKEIGWRDKQSARRIVIVITDATFHFAGDGLLGGVVKPNDGYCYTVNGTYMASTLMDYPSPGFLKKRLIDEQVSPIFAINQSKVDVYRQYQELVTFFGSESGAVSESLREDSSNLLQLIRQAYEKIAKTQTIRDTAPEGVKVNYTAYCPSVKGVEKSRAHCSGNGTLICGQCICDQGWAGRKCQCTEESKAKPNQCLRDNTTETKECSGDGTCLCGDCVCKKNDLLPGEIINGKYCECSNMDCPRDRDTGLICGGPERGECVCGNCNCSGNWTGQSCSCTKRTDSCIKDGVLCNGFGTCECGNCVCNASTPYRGKYCDECPSCVGKCSQNKNCVQCLVFKSGQLSADQCKSRCKDFKIEEVDELSPEMGERCTFRDSDDCSFTFSYKENPGKDIKIFVQKEKVCPKEAEALAVILGVVGGVLGVGIALILIWKLLATIQDRREFAKFEKDRQNAQWDTGENPIFKQPTTTFQNPTYGGK
ncbi:PREDICTED: integrin beta-PS-like [Acropora digitifera]|uniref:integrin beta-PS-like n=1 Tax=Acropora digitifera TaxID=70779 RepID=UPI00077AA792|nr:PREDICTED: integrin beta-PS-like [Acropora digitifera]